MIKNFHKAYNNHQSNSISELDKVILLYKGMIKLINQAKEAIIAQKIEERYNNLFKASQVMQGLLNVIDFEKGGDIALILKDFYTQMMIRTLKINHNPDPKLCDNIIVNIQEMLNAWNDIKAQNLNKES